MKVFKSVLAVVTVFLLATHLYAQEENIPNRLIDFQGFLRVSGETSEYRVNRRVTEDQFIEMSEAANTIILDTRSAEKYRQMHIAGALHLNYSDITKETLQRVIPSKETRVLIYCNNNFENAPKAFPTKMLTVALNIPTFITLYAYGYQNLYELGPVIDPAKSKIRFAGEEL